MLALLPAVVPVWIVVTHPGVLQGVGPVQVLLPLLKVVPFVSEGERVVDGDPTNGVNHLFQDPHVDHGVVINRYAE